MGRRLVFCSRQTCEMVLASRKAQLAEAFGQVIACAWSMHILRVHTLSSGGAGIRKHGNYFSEGICLVLQAHGMAVQEAISLASNNQVQELWYIKRQMHLNIFSRFASGMSPIILCVRVRFCLLSSLLSCPSLHGCSTVSHFWHFAEGHLMT